MSIGSIIKVIGVGGGGTNAVTHMYSQGIRGVDFAICNTDQQSLDISPVPVKIQLGPLLTVGRGAGNNPEVGKQACLESVEDLKSFLQGDTKMLFITAGMGGGTGTGAAPILSKIARELGILTVGIITLPFLFEGPRRGRLAHDGLEQLKQNVDALIVVSNNKLREMYGNLPMSSAFSHADNVLAIAAKGIAEIITVPGYINVDFEDVNFVMKDSGVAIMGSAVAGGEDRARKVVESALNSPLLEDNDIRGAKHILLNITTGRNPEITMDEVGEITEYIQQEAGYETDLIWGSCVDDSLNDQISITLIATGFGAGYKDRNSQSNAQKINLDQEEHGVSELFEDVASARVFDFEDSDDLQAKKVNSPSLFDMGANSFNHFKKKEEPVNPILNIRNPGYNNQRPALTDVKNLSEAENIPAYERRNVRLDNLNHSSELNTSRIKMVMDEDNKPEIREENSFLHDNVD
ncbi:MAG: cell division protein FtsZ [Saprospiraceae bacterium]|nr:cell division protein FtsZ [Saprospiraceae bacterium]MBK7736375.1 cell division protein FtsZ [Saprospiraceae bacterium]MBK7912260.1 cell division protein FtsZ [Saprospiraceae bacterium]